MTQDQNIKIGDLGVSKYKDFDDSSLTRQTQTFNIGTIKYMSPEIRENRSYSYNTDVW